MTKENIEEIKKAYEEFVKVVGFECLGCAKCETIETNAFILLMNEEIEILREKDKLYGVRMMVAPHTRIRGFGAYLKIDEKTNKCVFLNKDNRCKIHEYKPLICFLHPFQMFTIGFMFGSLMIFDTKCSWVKKNRSKLDKPSKCILDAYTKLYNLVMNYKIKIRI